MGKPGHLPFTKTVLAGSAFVIMLALTALISLQYAPKASAASCTDNGRACGYGYFTNKGPVASGHNMFTPALTGLYANNLGDLLGKIGSKMQCINTGKTGSKFGMPESDQNATSAAFIVLTMLGASPGTAKSKACERYLDWVSLMTAYDKAGRIHYNEFHDFDCINTLFTSTYADVVYYKECGAAQSIVVYGTNGKALYAIKRDCGNPIGYLQKVPPVVTPPTPPPTPPPTTPPTTPPVTPPTTPPPTTPPTAPPIAGSCGTLSATPAIPDPGTPYTIKVSTSYGSAADAATVRAQPDFKFSLKITGPNGPSVIYDNPSVTVGPPGGNQITAQVSLPATGKTGVFVVGWAVNATFGAVKCGSSMPGNPNPPTFTVLSKPYFTVNGGDISAGAAMSPAGGTNCAVTPNGSASIVSWNRDPSIGDYHGAGTQQAAFALNHLQEFATAQGNVTIPHEPIGLSFANAGSSLPSGTVSPSQGLYGGKLGGSSCVADYFANAKPSNTTSGPVKLSLLSGFPAGGNVPNGSKLVYYINGDLLVDSSVKYSGSYPSVTDIPSFSVVVKGNIYIDPTVQQLDGVYVAQPSSAAPGRGIVYTCAPSGFATTALNVLNQSLQNSCNKQLTVNGAFIARQMWLLRTAGTVSTTPSEVFNYTPELWLASPFGSGLTGGNSDYNAITSLPPVL